MWQVGERKGGWGRSSAGKGSSLFIQGGEEQLCSFLRRRLSSKTCKPETEGAQVVSNESRERNPGAWGFECWVTFRLFLESKTIWRIFSRNNWQWDLCQRHRAGNCRKETPEWRDPGWQDAPAQHRDMSLGWKRLFPLDMLLPEPIFSTSVPALGACFYLKLLCLFQSSLLGSSTGSIKTGEGQ